MVDLDAILDDNDSKNLFDTLDIEFLGMRRIQWQ